MSACAKSVAHTDFESYKRVDELPFDSETRSMTVVCENENGDIIHMVKGSADVIIPSCDYIFSANGTEERISPTMKIQLWRIIIRGILIGICTLGTFTFLLKSSNSIETARTGALITLVLSQLIHVFECKSEEKTLFSVSYFSNVFLIFSVVISAATLVSGIYFPILQNVFQQ